VNWQDGETAIIHLGGHVFSVEKCEQGFYLFESSPFVEYALNPLKIKSENQLASVIIKNCTRLMNNDNVAFSIQVTSYVSQLKAWQRGVDEAIYAMQSELNHYPEVKKRCVWYYDKKMSRLDFALSFQTIVKNEKTISKSLSALIKSVEYYIENQGSFISHCLHYDEKKINETAFKYNTSLLHFACKYYQLSLIKKILISNSVNVNQATMGLTPLYLTSYNGQTDIVKLLLAHPDIQVNQAHKNGVTPLHAAIIFGHIEMIKLLLAANANFLAKAGGLSCLELAKILGVEQIVKLVESQFTIHREVFKEVLTKRVEMKRQPESKFSFFTGWLPGISEDMKIHATKKMIKALDHNNKKLITFSHDELMALRHDEVVAKNIEQYQDVLPRQYLDCVKRDNYLLSKRF
jgi:ankyrin repeat protein